MSCFLIFRVWSNTNNKTLFQNNWKDNIYIRIERTLVLKERGLLHNWKHSFPVNTYDKYLWVLLCTSSKSNKVTVEFDKLHNTELLYKLKQKLNNLVDNFQECVITPTHYSTLLSRSYYLVSNFQYFLLY